MKIHHVISGIAACFVLFGCATQPPAKNQPGAVLDKPEDLPAAPSGTSYSEDDKPPKLIHAVNPIYPLEERKNGIVGTVVVRFIVDTDGNVVSAVAVQAPDAVLAKAVVDAVSQWKYIPGVKGGKKVNVRLEVPLTFSL